MRTTRDRSRESGSVMIVAMLALVALVSLGGLTALSVQGGVSTSGHDRFKSVSLYAAESGAAVAMDFLRRNLDPTTAWGQYVVPNNIDPLMPTGIEGNGAQPGDTDNLFSADMQAWYEVRILNNMTDPEFATGGDADQRVIIQATGHGPDGTTSQVEWEIQASGVTSFGRPCPVYGQKGLAEDGAGRNDCLSVIESTDVATFSPGGGN